MTSGSATNTSMRSSADENILPLWGAYDACSRALPDLATGRKASLILVTIGDHTSASCTDSGLVTVIRELPGSPRQ